MQPDGIKGGRVMAFIKAKNFLTKLEKDEAAFVGSGTCSVCGCALQESITGCRKLGSGEFCCSDCYFRGLGDELEEFPLIPPRVHRRA